MINLIYTCIFHSTLIKERLVSFLESLRTSNIKNCDIILFCNMSDSTMIRTMLKNTSMTQRIQTRLLTQPMSELQQEYFNLKIFNLVDLSKYKNILYIDPKTVVRPSIQNLIETKLKKDKLYTLKGGFLGSVWHSEHQPFDFAKHNRNTPAFERIMFMFSYSNVIRMMFERIIRKMDLHESNRKKHAKGWTQPYLVYECVSNNLNENELLSQHCQINPKFIHPSKALVYQSNTKTITKLKEKIIVCFFGVISRSIQYTLDSLNTNVLKPLKDKYDVDIYLFNNNIGNEKIDGKVVKHVKTPSFIVPVTHYEEMTQKEIDLCIDKDIKKKNIKVKFRGDYSATQMKNAIRQMYSEYKTGCFLKTVENKYKTAIVCGPDLFVANKININDVEKSMIDNHVYTTHVNPAQGLTNGFYIGKPSFLGRILKRYQKLETFLPTDKDYEYILYQSFKREKIGNKYTPLVFFKIRANKIVHWQGFRKLHFLSHSDKEVVLSRFLKLHKGGFNLI